MQKMYVWLWGKPFYRAAISLSQPDEEKRRSENVFWIAWLDLKWEKQSFASVTCSHCPNNPHLYHMLGIMQGNDIFLVAARPAKCWVWLLWLLSVEINFILFCFVSCTNSKYNYAPVICNHGPPTQGGGPGIAGKNKMCQIFTFGQIGFSRQCRVNAEFLLLHQNQV